MPPALKGSLKLLQRAGVPPGLWLPASGVEAGPGTTGLLLAPGFIGLLASWWRRRQRAA